MIYTVTGCHFIVPLDIYGKEVMFMFGYAIDRACRVLAQYSDKKDVRWIIKQLKKHPLNYQGLTITARNGTTLIIMNVMPTTAQHFGCVAHEIFHATEFIMNSVDNPLQEDGNSESWAYMIDWLTQEVQGKLATYYV